MGEIVNLRMARKQKVRVEREETAASNRALHGRTKAESLSLRKSAERAEAMLDGHRRERADKGAGKGD